MAVGSEPFVVGAVGKVLAGAVAVGVVYGSIELRLRSVERDVTKVKPAEVAVIKNNQEYFKGRIDGIDNTLTRIEDKVDGVAIELAETKAVVIERTKE